LLLNKNNIKDKKVIKEQIIKKNYKRFEIKNNDDLKFVLNFSRKKDS